jgi:hypothetical protein
MLGPLTHNKYIFSGRMGFLDSASADILNEDRYIGSFVW